MDELAIEYKYYLATEKMVSENTINSYMNDMKISRVFKRKIFS